MPYARGAVPSRRPSPLWALVVLAAAAVSLAHLVTGLGGGLLELAPALVLALPLLTGRYVGEERIAALAELRTRNAPRASVARSVGLIVCTPRVTVARGGALVGASLARRGPPAARVAAA